MSDSFVAYIGYDVRIEQSGKKNGLSKIAATVAVARKIARTAWAVYNTKQPYNARQVLSQEISA